MPDPAPPLLMTAAERLARAVLLFHRGGRWTGQDRNEWVMLTGEEEATTKVLCDLARRVAAEERMCEDCGERPADPPSRLCPGCEAYREHTGRA